MPTDCHFSGDADCFLGWCGGVRLAGIPWDSCVAFLSGMSEVAARIGLNFDVSLGFSLGFRPGLVVGL